MMDLLYEKEDCRAAEDSLKSALFKEEFCDDGPFGSNDFNVDDLLCSFSQNAGAISAKTEEYQDEGFHTFDIPDFSFDGGVMDTFDSGLEAASDSGLSTEFMFSPSSGTTSPDPRVDISIDTTDTGSDVSSTSDLGSYGSVESSPSSRSDSNYSFNPGQLDLRSTVQTQYDDDIEMNCLPLNCMSEKNTILVNSPKTIITSPQFITKPSSSITNLTPTTISTRSIKVELTQPSKFIKQINGTTGSISSIKSNFSSSNIVTLNTNSTKCTTTNTSNNFARSQILTKVRLDTGKLDTCKPGQLKNTQTIVVTQPGKAVPIMRNTAFLKATASGRQILVPVNVNDLNQMKKIKIISTSNPNNRPVSTGVRTLVSPVRPVATSTSVTNGNRTTLYTTTSKGLDGRSLFKITPTALVTPNSHTETPNISVTPSYIKEETSDDEATPEPNQELVLTEEEKRLMRKEGLPFPSRYPLTKQEERDLKRIRRKIRNKISAQDSRKRKKEYVDGLEDRVKSCTDENLQLQKRIKTLEKHNETLVAQLKKFHSLVGLPSRPHNHASTALMMLILSTALIFVPNLRPQDVKGENELIGESTMPATGHSRSLLEVKSGALNMKNLDGLSSTDDDEEVDSMDFKHALSDHDYDTFAKKIKLEALTPTYYPAPNIDKTLPRENGDPPDSGGGLNSIAAMFGAMLDRLGSNWTDPGGSFGKALNRTPPHVAPERSVVVNLNPTKRLRDDIELE